jgi:hypothetical protein
MIQNHYLQKGDRVRAVYFAAKPLGTYSIAGAQPKVIGDEVEVVGTVTHIRGNHPTNPTSIRVWVQPDAGGEEVRLDPACIREVLNDADAGSDQDPSEPSRT